jgi:serine/threonine protein kinase
MRDIYPREDQVLLALQSEIKPKFFLPSYYGTVDIEKTTYLKKSFIYGQPLSDYCRGTNLFSKTDAFYIVGTLAYTLQYLLTRGYLFLDIRPENVLVCFTTERAFWVGFPDIGLSVPIKDPQNTEVKAAVSHPRYCAPETAMENNASEKSVVFQLGLIAQELLTGIHPFDKFPQEPRWKEWDRNCYRHLDRLGASFMNPQKYPTDAENKFVTRMLDFDPKLRPTLAECMTEFLDQNKNSVTRRGIRVPETKNNCVLFPARMGIPHQGHINFMSRILDLGYKLIVSIQRSYTSTERDPVPKWLVMKMVAQSLLDLGYPKDSFKFFLTPFYKTRPETKMHFGMLPGIEDVVAVASSNESVHELFEEYSIIEQKHVFGSENECYTDLSWGEIIRASVQENDYTIFQKYVATGVEKICSFEELRRICLNRPEIPFVEGKVKVRLIDEKNSQIAEGRVFKYLTPEESLIKHFDDETHNHQIKDPYSKDTSILFRGLERKLSYIQMQITDQDEIITFKLL